MSFASLLRASLLPSALLLAACPGSGPDSNASLADLPRLRVSVQTYEAGDDRPAEGFVTVSYDEDAFIAAHGRCATLDDDLGGNLDGTDLDATSFGSDDEEFGGCFVPHLPFEIRFADDHASVLTIADHSVTVRAEFPAGAFEAHGPTLIAPTAWRFRGGQEVRVRWSHPADLAEAPLRPTDVGFHIGDRGKPNANGDNFFPLSPQVEGDELRFTIPSPPPITGPGLITFQMGYSVGEATTCTGATTCAYSASRSFDHSVEIER
jgi:hypothetical protein